MDEQSLLADVDLRAPKFVRVLFTSCCLLIHKAMKLGSTAALSLALASGVSGFVPSLDSHAAIGGHRGTRTSTAAADGGHLSVAAAPVDEATTTASSSSSDSDDQQIEITDVHSVKALGFRQLQKACVARGLPAVGNTAALRSRLLESAGLPDVSAPSAPASAVNGSDDEVSRLATTNDLGGCE